MKSFFLLALVMGLMGCAVVDPGAIDADGKNGLERAIADAMGLQPENQDEKFLLPPPAELVDAAPHDSPKMEASQQQDLSSEGVQVADAKPGLQLDDDERVFPVQKIESRPEPPLEPGGGPAPSKQAAAKAEPAIQNEQPVDQEQMAANDSHEERFPEPKTPEEALKKYMNKKRGQDEVLVPERPRARGIVGLKEKFSGVVGYMATESVYQSKSQELLQKLADRLVKNPGESVLFQGQMAEGESYNLMQMRFDFIKRQLQQMKVHSDQIILDEKIMVGDWPEFKMYILRL